MIEMRLAELSTTFSDRALIAAADATTRRRGLRIVGQDLRRDIRRSIKSSRPGPDGRYPRSTPGGPPSYRVVKGTPKGQNKFAGSAGIIYVYDGSTQSVVVGARKLSTRQSPPMPVVLEQGGVRESDIRRWTGIRHRKVGGSGEIRIGGSMRGSTVRRVTVDGESVRVVYAKLRTAKQARRAQRLNIQLFASPNMQVPSNFRSRHRIAARPYVEPQWDRYRGSGKVSQVFVKLMAEQPPLRGRMKKVKR